jgi:dihydropteroate synthase
MGVVNVTPDSFSDGGEWFEPSAAIKHGRELLAEGADLLDVGGESTRPGAVRPAPAEELRRVIPVIEALAADSALISIDTMRADVAALALDAGAVMVNDVSGGLADRRTQAAGGRDAGRRDRPGTSGAGPGPGVREERRPQLGDPAPAARVRRTGVAVTDRCVPQGVPR